MSDLIKLTPPKELDQDACLTIFQHLFRRLAAYRNTVELYALAEYNLSISPEEMKACVRDEFGEEVNRWAHELLKHAWIACHEPGGGKTPILDPLSDTSTSDLPSLPPQKYVTQLLNVVLFLQVTSSKVYSAHTRSFLFSFISLNEDAVSATLKDPKHAVEEAERKTSQAKADYAEKGKTLRRFGIGLGAVAGGVLIGVTGGLAAPLVGAGVSAVFGFLGVGGTAAGLLASGLASSSVVCGALFGVYGSKRSAEMIERYTKEVQDLAILPVREPQQTLAVRLCVTGWLDSPEDEVEALQQLSNALSALIKAQAMKYVKAEIIKRTVFASLWAALSPTAWLKIAQIIDNPWMTAKSLATKAGRVLGMLLHQRILGNRPVTLVGYSLGSVVIFEALQYLASLPPSETADLIEDVYLFGAPVPTDERTWTAARRVVAGRLVNGYGSQDYILAVLSRLSNVSWGVAGLGPVSVKGVENIACDQVDGHLKWRGMIGQCLAQCAAPGIVSTEVEKQLEQRAVKIGQEMDMDEKDADQVLAQKQTLALP
ncbi:DUF726-domain-containing protein [Amylocystis lapponica]|nr:DUF726-domain-containing protein [Amylocystis lapponica]